MKAKPLYIETHINCPPDELWRYTQDPAIHRQWDLRFSDIEYLPKEEENSHQQFLYATRIGFGLRIAGKGESVGTKNKLNGESTSALKFWSDEKLSLIKTGSGYWKYIPGKEGVRFVTGYDYEVRYGGAGKLIDYLVFRPLIGWATAWSFDALKRWLEKGIHPGSSLRQFLILFIIRINLGLIWIYQGLIPKLLYMETGELQLMQSSGLFKGIEPLMVNVFGIAEIVFGFILLLWSGRKLWHYLNIIGLILLMFGAALGRMGIYKDPFNPATLSLAMISLSVISLICMKDLPKASNCLRKPLKA
jgi:hypothetical protein